MASLLPNAVVVVVAVAAVVLAALVAGGSSSTNNNNHPKVPPGPNITADYDGKWLAAKATWYGSPVVVGAGPNDDDGACGFGDVNLPPYVGMASCGNSPIFKDGKGCGSCYEIRCAQQECSGEPAVVFITDVNDYPLAPYHFDLSGTAFGAMARPGLADELRHRGIIDVDFRRVRCRYAPGKNIEFHVEHESNPPFHLALLVKFVAGDGDVVKVELKQRASPEWEPMDHSRGAVWRIEMDPHKKPLVRGPFSIRLTSESGKELVAADVIPVDWKPGTIYQSNIQF